MKMRSISIYNYLDRFVIVPNQQSKSGLTYSANKFIVSDEHIMASELWSLIKEGLSKFKILDFEYDRNSAASKNFNKDLSKSVGTKSYTEFWKNSQLITLVEKDETIIIHTSKRALNHKSYQGSFLPPEEFDNQIEEIIVNRILDLFKLMNE